MSRRRTKRYSKELKEEAVKAYLDVSGSYETASKKYGLLNNTQQ